MNKENLIKLVKNIDKYLWIMLAIGLVFTITMSALIGSKDKSISQYLVSIFIINTILAIYTSTKGKIIAYIIASITILINIFSILLIF